MQRFAVIGDFGSGLDGAAAVAKVVISWNPDFVVTVGDNAYDGLSPEQAVGRFYCRFLSGVPPTADCPAGSGSATNKFFPSAGNHDYDDGGGIEAYLTYFDLPGAGVNSSSGVQPVSELWYEVQIGHVCLFVLDSEGALWYRTMSEQRAWLQAALADARPACRWKVVAMHHPPFSSGWYHGSFEAMQWPFGAWGAHLVLAGHDHLYERFVRDDAVYAVVRAHREPCTKPSRALARARPQPHGTRECPTAPPTRKRIQPGRRPRLRAHSPLGLRVAPTPIEWARRQVDLRLWQLAAPGERGAVQRGLWRDDGGYQRHAHARALRRRGGGRQGRRRVQHERLAARGAHEQPLGARPRWRDRRVGAARWRRVLVPREACEAACSTKGRGAGVRLSWRFLASCDSCVLAQSRTRVEGR